MDLKRKFLCYIKKNTDSIVEVCGAIFVSLIFLSGVGRYRIVLVYAVYSWVAASSLLFRDGKYIRPILFPAAAIALFYDFKNGPIFPIFTKNNLFVALAIMIIVDVLIRNIANLMISNVVQGELFVVCPECRFDNKGLVKICSNCNYKTDSDFVKIPSMSNKKSDDVLYKIVTFLPMVENEKIRYQKKLTRNIACYKNGERKLRKHLVITTKRVALVDYNSLFAFSKTIVWRDKDIIEIDDIESVECRMKPLFMATRPFLVITSVNKDVYEIAFSCFSKYKEELVEIANIIKLENHQVRIAIDLTEMPWR